MYESVIRPHATSILHSDQINNIQAPTTIRHYEQRIQNLANGQLAVPVQINTKSMVQDATLSNYETPLFLSKGPRKLNIPMKDYIALRRAEGEDARILREKLIAQKSYKARIKARKLDIFYFLVKQERDRLRDETKALTKNLTGELDNLLKSKKISQKLEVLLKKYEMKVKKDQLEKSKVVDRQQLKKELKEKILREVQGLRSFANKESLLSKVNQKELNKVINKIKRKLAK